MRPVVVAQNLALSAVWVITSQAAHAVIFRYVVQYARFCATCPSLPFFYVFMYSVPFFALALIYFIRKVWTSDTFMLNQIGVNPLRPPADKDGLFLQGVDYVIIGFPYAVYHILMAAALSRGIEFGASGFLAVSVADYLLKTLLSGAILKRIVTHPWLRLLAGFIIAGAIILFVFVAHNFFTNQVTWVGTNDYILPILLALGARIALVSRGLIARYYILSRRPQYVDPETTPEAIERKKIKALYEQGPSFYAQDPEKLAEQAIRDKRQSRPQPLHLFQCYQRLALPAPRRSKSGRNLKAGAASGNSSGSSSSKPAAGANAASTILEPVFSPGYDDIYLSRLDNLFDSPVYDALALSTDSKRTWEMDLLGGALSLMPASLLASFFARETPLAYSDIGLSSDSSTVIVYVLLAFLAVSVPVHSQISLKVATRISSMAFTCLEVFSYLVGIFVSCFVMSEYLTTIQFIAMVILAAAAIYSTHATDEYRRKSQLPEDAAMIREWMPEVRESDIENLLNLHHVLSHEDYQRMLSSTALRLDGKQWQRTALAVTEITTPFPPPPNVSRRRFGDPRTWFIESSRPGDISPSKGGLHDGYASEEEDDIEGGNPPLPIPNSVPAAAKQLRGGPEVEEESGEALDFSKAKKV